MFEKEGPKSRSYFFPIINMSNLTFATSLSYDLIQSLSVVLFYVTMYVYIVFEKKKGQ